MGGTLALLQGPSAHDAAQPRRKSSFRVQSRARPAAAFLGRGVRLLLSLLDLVRHIAGAGGAERSACLTTCTARRAAGSLCTPGGMRVGQAGRKPARACK